MASHRSNGAQQVYLQLHMWDCTVRRFFCLSALGLWQRFLPFNCSCVCHQNTRSILIFRERELTTISFMQVLLGGINSLKTELITESHTPSSLAVPPFSQLLLSDAPQPRAMNRLQILINITYIYIYITIKAYICFRYYRSHSLWPISSFLNIFFINWINLCGKEISEY